MKLKLNILFCFTIFAVFSFLNCNGQVKRPPLRNQQPQHVTNQQQSKGVEYKVSTCVYKGDTIPSILYPTVYIYPPMTFNNDQDRMNFLRLVYNVKKVLPIAIEINNLIIETYEYLETLPNDKAKMEHIKRVEKGLKEQYTVQMKKLSYAQGKLLIKLVDRESNQTSFDLIKAFMGPFKAFSYQTFAALFGASLRKQYDPKGEDKLTERAIVMVSQGQI
jgi:hypothetical protein